MSIHFLLCYLKAMWFSALQCRTQNRVVFRDKKMNEYTSLKFEHNLKKNGVCNLQKSSLIFGV